MISQDCTDYMDKPDEFVISALLGSNSYHNQIFSLVKEEYFTYKPLREIFKMIKNPDYLPKGDIKEINRLIGSLSGNFISGAAYQFYCDRLRKEYEQTIIQKSAAELKNAQTSEEYFGIINQVNKALQRENQAGRVVSFSDDDAFEGFVENYYKGFDMIKTGYQPLDEIIGGFRNGETIILAGATSMGKTAFALNLLMNCAKSGKKALFFSMEMKAAQLLTRIVCSEANVDASRVRSCKLDSSEVVKLQDFYNEYLRDLPVNIVDTSKITIEDIFAKSQQIQPNIVFIDYLGLIGSHGNLSKYEEISELSRQVKLLAGELNVPVVCLAQINRAPSTRVSKRPLLSDLRDSGSIEQDADIVMFVYRDEYYDPNSKDRGKIEISVQKNRSGSVGYVKLNYDKARQRIY